MIAEIGQPTGMLNHIVEQIAMYNPQAFAIGRLMDIILPDRDLTQIIAKIMTGSFIMSARDIDHAGAVTRFSQQFLNDVIMFLWPVEALFQLPAVNNITNQIEGFTSGVF